MTASLELTKCPHCAEEIQIAAKKCKHCGEFLENDAPGAPAKAQATKVRKMPYWKALLHCISIGVTLMVTSMVILFPLLFLGMVLVITSPIMALFMMEGGCPYCGNVNVIIPPKTTVKCRHCKQRSVLRGMSLTPLKTA